MTAQTGWDLISATPSADVATNGTITFNYPSGRVKTDYAQALETLVSHGLQTKFSVGANNFSMAYGTSSVVLTYLGATSLPAGKSVNVQLPLAKYKALTDNSGGAVSGGLAAGVGIFQMAFYTNLIDITAADFITNIKPGFNGKILGIHFVQDKPATTGSKLATLTPKIGSTNVTGGALALTSAGCTPQGVKTDGSAISALNVFGPTDTIGIVGSAVTAFVEGNGWVILDIQNMDVANAFAALADKVSTLTTNDVLFDRIPS